MTGHGLGEKSEEEYTKNKTVGFCNKKLVDVLVDIYDQPTLSLRQLGFVVVMEFEILDASVDAAVVTARDSYSPSKICQQKRFDCGNQSFFSV